MVVQHNLPAMNSHRQLGINNSGTSKNLEKLSSGFRINRAGDDAAGLAISEKMRGQIRGLDMATTNAENGVSLIQTAEGGLNETHAILQRMRELAVQSSNGTYGDDVDRENIDKEVQALKSEVDRIASSTHYNGINLLDGSMGGTKAEQADVDAIATGLALNSVGAAAAGLTGTGAPASVSATLIKKSFDDKSTDDDVYALQIGDQMFSTKTGDAVAGTLYNQDGVSVGTISGFSGTASTGTVTDGSAVVSGIEVSTSGMSVGTSSRAGDTSSQLVFQIGANGGADQRVGLNVGNMSSASLGGTKGVVANIDVRTRENANLAIDVLDEAVNQVSSTRADLGALQNRLEHTINNLGASKENLQAAESSIRDVDMAKEMMEFTKNNILVQASQSMLAQSNQLPQGVLQLLR